jgi:hypothetical protein
MRSPGLKNALSATQVDDQISVFSPFDDPVHELADTIPELAENVVSLRFTDLLKNDLFGGLGRDPSQDIRGLVNLDLLTNLG